MLISYFCNIARIFLLTLNIIKNKYYDLTYGHEQSSAQLGFHYSWYRLAVAYLLWNHVQLLLAHVKGLEQFGIIFLEIWTDFLILCISKKIHPISFFWNVKNLSVFFHKSTHKMRELKFSFVSHWRFNLFVLHQFCQ